jgi:hypothetical protein
MVAAGAVTFPIPERRKRVLIMSRPSREAADAMAG